jgi:hypothetical protein
MRFIAFFLCIAPAFAQSSGTITGTIHDVDGTVVAKAPIQVANKGSNLILKTISSQTGAYTFAQLPPGTYELTVAATGFNAYLQPNVTIAPAQTLRLDVELVDYQFGTLGDGREFRIELLSPHATPPGPAPRAQNGKPDLSPGAHCLPRGITNAGALFPYRLVQTPSLLVMLFEDDIPSHRQIFLDGRSHPKDMDPKWMGHSVGHWEGDTLVVDTVGFDDRSWLTAQGHAHTEKMHVVERFRRPDLGHLEIEFTIDDPAAYATPWIIKRVSDLDTKDEVGEYVCTENNRDVEHLVGK